MTPKFVKAPTELGATLADHFHAKALAISPDNERVLVSPAWTLPLVEDIDQGYLGIADGKVQQLKSIPKDNSASRRVMEETCYHQIYNRVVTEGSTLTLPEVRHIIETGYSVQRKSLKEQNEVISVHVAKKYINTSLLPRTGTTTLKTTAG